MCPSCGGKRMQKVSDHLLSQVLPTVPVRQWVFTYPFRLRYRMAFDRRLASDIHRVAARAVHRHYRAAAKRSGHGAGAVSGSVTFVQRFGSALNLNVHFHLLAIDGVFVPSATERRGLAAFVALHGVLAANARHRAAVVACAAGPFVATEDRDTSTRAPTAARASAAPELELGDWARFMRSSFGLEVLTCLACGGRLRFVAHIQRAQAIQAMLAHAGEDPSPQVSSPPRDPPPGWPEDPGWLGC